jgi:outer membrane protein OmpA-like peptidoglycan-associated protein
MKRLLLFLAALVVLCSMNVQAQERLRFGLFGHAMDIMSTASFTALPNVPCCSPGFGDSQQWGFDAGLMVDLPLNKYLVVSGRLGYFMYGAPVSSTENRLMNVGGEAVPGEIYHSIDVSRNAIALEATIGLQPIRDLTFYVGPHVGYLITKTYSQYEELVAPATGTFENGERQRLQSSGDLPNAVNPAFYLTMGASYDIALTDDRTWFVGPDVAYMLPLTKVVSDLDWKTSALRFGLTVKYSPLGDEGPRGPNYRSNLKASVSASGLEADGRELPSVTLRVEEFLSTQMKPLLPYVFFSENSAQIPPRYARRNAETIRQFSEQRLHNASMLDAYHEVLNVIGRRMLEYPDARITITGCTTEQGVEASNPKLSDQRARAVRDYLVQVWGIAPDRITVQTRGLPSVPSNVKERDGIEENRRAEITTTDPRVLDPIWTTDTSRTITPPGIRFRMLGSVEGGLDSWTLQALQDDVLVKEFSGRDSMPAYIDWDLQNDQTHVPRAPSSIDYVLSVKDLAGNIVSEEGPSIGVEQITLSKKRRERIKDMEIDRYSLIAFDFADSTVSAQNARLLERIKKNVSLAATVHVSGHTDRIGDPEFNQRLSEGRARNVAAALNAGTMSVEGKGAQGLLYNNDLPEGRFYSRTVNILVETPIE